MITVYHINNFRDSMDFYFEVPASVDMSNYSKVASVDTEDMNMAFQLTNHIDHNWTENREVKAESDQVRSTSVGDVMEKDGNFYFVSSIGFKEVSVGGNQHV